MLFRSSLSVDFAIYSVREKLHEPLRIAADHGVKLLLETHGRLTDDLGHLERLLHECDSPALGLNLDTGNLWLGGGDPVAFVRKFMSKIHHVHWKDMPESMLSERGKKYGCGMSTIPLGSGVVDIRGVFIELQKNGFDGHTTLEVAGETAVLQSRRFLQQLGAR